MPVVVGFASGCDIESIVIQGVSGYE